MSSYENEYIGISAPNVDQEVVKDFVRFISNNEHEAYPDDKPESQIEGLVYRYTCPERPFEHFSPEFEAEEIYTIAKKLFGKVTVLFEKHEGETVVGYWKDEIVIITPDDKLHYSLNEYCDDELSGIDGESIFYHFKDKFEEMAKEAGIEPEWEKVSWSGEMMPKGVFAGFCIQHNDAVNIDEVTKLEFTEDIEDEEVDLNEILGAARENGCDRLAEFIINTQELN